MCASMPTPTANDGPSTRLGVIEAPTMEAHVQKVVTRISARSSPGEPTRWPWCWQISAAARFAARSLGLQVLFDDVHGAFKPVPVMREQPDFYGRPGLLVLRHERIGQLNFRRAIAVVGEVPMAVNPVEQVFLR